MKYTEFARVFKAMSDEKRLMIINMLSKGSLCACKILEQFDFTQPALSQHMKVLVEAGLVSGIRIGNWMHYSLVKEKYEEAVTFIKQITDEDKDRDRDEDRDRDRDKHTDKDKDKDKDRDKYIDKYKDKDKDRIENKECGKCK